MSSISLYVYYKRKSFHPPYSLFNDSSQTRAVSFLFFGRVSFLPVTPIHVRPERRDITPRVVLEVVGSRRDILCLNLTECADTPLIFVLVVRGMIRGPWTICKTFTNKGGQKGKVPFGGLSDKIIIRIYNWMQKLVHSQEKEVFDSSDSRTVHWWTLSSLPGAGRYLVL